VGNNAEGEEAAQTENERKKLEDTPQADCIKEQKEDTLQEGNFEYQENCKGISFDHLLVPYLKKAKIINIVDPYLRSYWQIRNLMELLTGLIRTKGADEEITINIVTKSDECSWEKQVDCFDQMVTSLMPAGIHLNYRFDTTIHDREITTDTGWKIILGRGLDIFQVYDGNSTFSLQNTVQEYRACKSFNITYIKTRK
jgi:ATP-dependent Lon protease